MRSKDKDLSPETPVWRPEYVWLEAQSLSLAYD